MKPATPADNEALLALLPALLADIARLIGVPGALKLIDRHGGTRLYVPEQIPRGHALVTLLGHGEALLLAERYGGDRIDIPVAHGWRRAMRNAAIMHERRSGTPQPAVARRYGMTERGIRMIERQCEAGDDDVQYGLF
ncbi:Mor transcription activator family protein [Denitromonas halophila]|uniref:Mor transcription activator family protein n=1 Tax=Denitromonas halophila TaxID=1629404 RepID=UPI0016436A36|nr:Mor transcription activator family protein [Denitromonas halophila]